MLRSTCWLIAVFTVALDIRREPSRRPFLAAGVRAVGAAAAGGDASKLTAASAFESPQRRHHGEGSAAVEPVRVHHGDVHDELASLADLTGFMGGRFAAIASEVAVGGRMVAIAGSRSRRRLMTTRADCDY